MFPSAAKLPSVGLYRNIGLFEILELEKYPEVLDEALTIADAAMGT